MFEETFRRVAGKGYFGVSILSFIYILWRGSWDIKFAAILVVACFVTYVHLDPAPEDSDRRDS